MLDRRDFVRCASAGVGSALAAQFALAATPVGELASYRRVSLHWTGERLLRRPDAEPRVGDFTAFAVVRGGAVEGPIDLFVVDAPSAGDERDGVLVPIGRVADLAAGRRAILARRARGDDPA